MAPCSLGVSWADERAEMGMSSIMTWSHSGKDHLSFQLEVASGWGFAGLDGVGARITY